MLVHYISEVPGVADCRTPCITADCAREGGLEKGGANIQTLLDRSRQKDQIQDQMRFRSEVVDYKMCNNI